MPLDEEGAKWSCEPCIRGHRSSKCQHFDRLMMKVPKAGRPLAKCPHPKGSCSCQKLYAFMIRIPKGSSCVCRPLYQVPVEPGEPAPTAASTPIAPSPSPASGKIQKSSNKKQIKVAPENLAKALDSIPEFGNHHAETKASHQPSSPSAFGLRPVEGDGEWSNDTRGSITSQSSNRIEQPKSQSASCCSKKSQSPAEMQPRSSCCGKANPPSSNCHGEQPSRNELHNALASNHTGSPYTPISTAHFPTWQQMQALGPSHYAQPFLSHPPQSGLPHYIPHYSQHTASESLTNFTRPDLSSDIGFSPAIMPHTLSTMAYPVAHPFGDSSSHDCHCGDTCQCLGCASHPFNNTTRQHVQQMGLLVALDGDDRPLETMNGFRNGSFSSNHHSPSATPFHYSYASFGQNFNNDTQSMPMPPFGDQASTSNNIHNGYSSPPTDYAAAHQMMEPSEYYTLEYPVGLPTGCSDITGSCQCGNDCSCVGCLTHSGHNGLPLEPLPTHSNNVTPGLDPTTSAGNEPRRGSIQAPVLPDTAVPTSASML